MPTEMKGAFHLLKAHDYGRIIGIEALCPNGCACVVVHAVLDAKRGLTVPATVIHVNDWTS